MVKKIISIILLILGIGIILYPKFSEFVNKKYQNEIIKKYEEKVYDAEDEEITRAKKYNENLIENNLQDVLYEDILNPSSDGVMGYIEIPKISARIPIYHGTEESVLKKGIGHIKESSFPIGGESTHAVLTGHSGLKRAEIFTRLQELNNNDYFFINIINNKLIYKIYNIETVLPSETKSLQIEKGKDIVTLITCTPYGVNTHRLLVHGERCYEENKNVEESLQVNKSNEITYNYYFMGLKLRSNNFIYNNFLLHFIK